MSSSPVQESPNSPFRRFSGKRGGRLLLLALAVALVTALGIAYFTPVPVAADAAADAPAASAAGQADGDVSSEAAFSDNPAAFRAIDEPFSDVRAPEEALIVRDPSRPAVLELPSGSVIRVPANAFVDAAGRPVTGPVTLRLREFREAAEIIASGIPMHVQMPGGAHEWLQTAGMFEISGFRGDEAVAIAPGKQLDIDFLSPVGGDFDVWVFSRETGNWTNLGPGADPQPVPARAAAAAREEAGRLRQLTARPPVNPETDKSDQLLFVDLDLSRCPDLQGNKSVVLAYAGSDPARAPRNNKWIADPGRWLKKELRPTPTPGLYQLTLMGDTVYRVEVRPALLGADLEAAKARYAEQLAQYRANLDLLRQKEAILAQQQAFRRTLSIGSFGIYNYDILWKQPDIIALQADFDFGNLPDQVKKLITVFLVTGDGRTVISLPSYDWDSFRFSPGMDNKLIAVLPDDRVALFTQSDFKREMAALKRAQSGQYVFKMNIQPEPVSTMAELQAVVTRAGS